MKGELSSVTVSYMLKQREKALWLCKWNEEEKEQVTLLHNEGDVKLQPSSAGLPNKSRTCLPFLMMWMMTRLSEGQRQSNTPGILQELMPNPTGLGPAAALQALSVPWRCSQDPSVQDPVLKWFPDQTENPKPAPCEKNWNFHHMQNSR